MLNYWIHIPITNTKHFICCFKTRYPCIVLYGMKIFISEKLFGDCGPAILPNMKVFTASFEEFC